MEKTTKTSLNNKQLVNIAELQELYSLGKGTLNKIGEMSGAVVRIGKRKLFNVSKMQKYFDDLTESENAGE